MSALAVATPKLIRRLDPSLTSPSDSPTTTLNLDSLRRTLGGSQVGSFTFPVGSLLIEFLQMSENPSQIDEIGFEKRCGSCLARTMTPVGCPRRRPRTRH
jgi:hypothetical protein